jgi:hypothetical protein
MVPLLSTLKTSKASRLTQPLGWRQSGLETTSLSYSKDFTIMATAFCLKHPAVKSVFPVFRLWVA